MFLSSGQNKSSQGLIYVVMAHFCHFFQLTVNGQFGLTALPREYRSTHRSAFNTVQRVEKEKTAQTH
jgi:hypothetical protein